MDKVSRRLMMRIFVTYGAVTETGSSYAVTKAAQSIAGYQPEPMVPAQCSNCLHFEAPASCKVVEGVIALVDADCSRKRIPGQRKSGGWIATVWLLPGAREAVALHASSGGGCCWARAENAQGEPEPASFAQSRPRPSVC
jgi:hypothetical protein